VSQVVKTNRFSILSLGLAATTFLIVAGYVQLSFPPSDSEESHYAIAMMAGTIFWTAAMIGVALGAIGILFATAALIRKERLTLVLLALAANLPIPILRRLSS
jgi:hypothetical protein